MRPWLVSKLASELLGPLHGSTEKLNQRPDLMYSLGILSPKKRKPEPENIQVEMITENSQNLQGDDAVEDDESPPAPWIDPTAKPSSMGLSFTCITQNQTPEFEICLTYSRYEYELSAETFLRKPRACVISWETIAHHLELGERISKAKLWLSPKNITDAHPELILCSKEVAEIGLDITIRSEFMDTNLWSITCLMHSQISPRSEDEKYDANLNSELNIHQPEIRIALEENTSLEEYSPETSMTDESSIDAALYRGRGQRARGHLCSAVWREFDPQNISSDVRSTMQIDLETEGNVHFGDKPPFAWIDHSVDPLKDSASKFYPPHARTEYLPMLNIAAPEMNPKWDNESVLSAQKLSEATSPTSIKQILFPLLDGYKNWIEDSFDEATQPHHKTLKIEAEDAHERMKKGVQLLINNPKALLAFNFANKALEVNSQWSNSRPLNWRKFQLSFALSVLESSTNPNSSDREHLDLLWVATGGGKTEAYLLVTAYLLAYKRLSPNTSTWQGVNVLTRYTLRLLTIQQYRRALGMITAMEWLRNTRKLNDIQIDFGTQSFSIGIWVGGSVTPNKICESETGQKMKPGWKNQIKTKLTGDFLQTHRITAVESLTGGNGLPDSKYRSAAEPAQILNCPSCSTNLSFTRSTEDTSRSTQGKIHWIVKTDVLMEDLIEIMLDDQSMPVNQAVYTAHHSNFYSLEIEMEKVDGIHEESVETLWNQIRWATETLGCNIECCSTRASRPGYFFRTYTDNNDNKVIYDFEIRCPNKSCDLNVTNWQASTPAGTPIDRKLHLERQQNSTEGSPIEIVQCWRVNNSNPNLARGCPIPAYTVDEQIYRQLPSLVIATVDKFARLSFQPKTAGLFGNITHHHETFGYLRAGAGMKDKPDQLPAPQSRIVEISNGLEAPSLIIQDELHLIEGPLGSMTGFYETVIEELIREGLPGRSRPKYIASTATIRSAAEQIRCLFDREVHLFPPKGPNWKDRGLLIENDEEPAHSSGEDAGRLYMGFCPIGVSGLGVQRDVYSNLLHSGSKLTGDRYWSIVGYYNAVRELAGARALIEQDVIGNLNRLAALEGISSRDINAVELSGRMVSSDLPILLNQLEKSKRGEDGCIDALLTTSMFGTGVDVNRLNIMLVGGQPKTTAQYIQATGRVGRKNGALVATYLRGSRPRDLDHYERFMSYHLQIHRYVEPVTVRPYSMAVLERAAGPLSVAWLRNSRVAKTIPWRMKNSAGQWNIAATRPIEFDTFIDIIHSRNQTQTRERQIVSRPPNAIQSILDSGWEKWANISDIAAEKGLEMNWVNYHLRSQYGNPPPSETHVVLGDERHVKIPDRHKAAYSPHYPAPQSLRAVDSTIGVQTRRS
jgi:hypothetical protein